MSDAKFHIVNKDGIVAPIGTMEDFKRPSHPDFMTSIELAAAKFNGFRNNTVTGDSEVWVEGERVITVTPEELQRDPLAVNKKMEDYFGLHKVLPDIPQLKNLYEGKD